MNAMNMPGFTSEASLYKIRGHYQSVTTQSYSSVEQGVVFQMRSGGLRGAAGPFSGSCGCGPGFCCCIFCYYDICNFGVGQPYARWGMSEMEPFDRK